MRNIDPDTVAGFGDEWSRFDQSQLSEQDRLRIFAEYFEIFPWDSVPQGAEGFDLGCGSGRWAALVAPRVGRLHCIDASDDALHVAQRMLAQHPDCLFHLASVGSLPLPNESQDFGYSLGVLHHVPDTAAALRSAVTKLKPGAPFLVYLYYAFDNRPAWFRLLWRMSDGARRVVARLPFSLRYGISQVLAALVYLPLATLAAAGARRGYDTANWPLSYYANRGFYVMRTDALDRFGTRLEQRFTRAEITQMLAAAGLDEIRFSDHAPYWCAVGIRRRERP
jgi:ubiquinone/menaquinone biosynthesis C-methylase UbiE